MELTAKGFKKPTTGDANDLYQFVGDNMDLLEVELDKKSNSNHTHDELHTHSNKAILDATEASYTTLEKNKLSGIESGANANQNAFSNVKVGTDLLVADSVTDTLEIVAGSNITITTDSSNDKLTISSKDTVYTHPSTHPASIIVQDSLNRFTTDTEKANWNGKLDATANAVSASKLVNGRSIALSGDVTGSIVFDGSENVTITTTVVDDSHSHSIDKVDGLQSELDGKETPSGAQIKVDAHANRIDNPHNVTKTQLGLSNVDNIQQATKSEFNTHNNDSVRHITSTERTNWNAKASTATATTTANGLISSVDKAKLDGVSTGANKVLNHTNNGSISVDGVEQIVYSHPTTHPASIIIQDTNNRFMTDAERTLWNAKSNLALGETSITAYRGDRGKVAYDHSQTTHAPTNAQKNSDITKTEIEEKLTGNITTHTHSYDSLDGKPYFAGTSAPLNKNVFWVDTN